MFRKFALAFSLSVLVIGAARADMLCNGLGGVQNVAAVGFSCNLGGLEFSGFTVSGVQGNVSPEIDLTGATIAADGTVNLSFDPHITTPADGGTQQVDFFFTVSGGVDQIDLSTGGVNAKITESVCDATFTGEACSGNQLASIVAFSMPPGPSSAISQFFDTTSPLYVFKDINVAPGGDGGALASFSQSFHPGSGSVGGPSAVPEPTSASLLGLALIGFAFLVRRLKKSSPLPIR